MPYTIHEYSRPDCTHQLCCIVKVGYFVQQKIDDIDITILNHFLKNIFYCMLCTAL